MMNELRRIHARGRMNVHYAMYVLGIIKVGLLNDE